MQTIVVETGAGLSNANSYASIADAENYMDSILTAQRAAWGAASLTDRTAVLLQATRTIDSLFRFNGKKATASQALQWPRFGCPDPDSDTTDDNALAASHVADGYFAENILPKEIKEACCELARQMLTGDRLAAPDSFGIKRVDIFEAVEVEFDKGQTPSPLTPVVQAMLAKFGTYTMSGGGNVKLTRV